MKSVEMWIFRTENVLWVNFDELQRWPIYKFKTAAVVLNLVPSLLARGLVPIPSILDPFLAPHTDAERAPA